MDVIDVEASGLDPDSYPIEIAVSVDGQMREWLIRPKSAWTFWSVAAEGIHGISRDQLNSEGLPVEQVADELESFLSDKTVYSDAANWDQFWVFRLFPNHQPSFQIAHLKDVLDWQLFLQNRQNLVESGQFQVHRAAEDVRLIQQAIKLTQMEL